MRSTTEGPGGIPLRKIVTGFLLCTYITIGSLDALLHGQTTFSSIMGMDIGRVYFYTFVLLTLGCWFLYNKWLVGTGFIALATFSSYFFEYVALHNYLASVVVYVGIVVDIIARRKIQWVVPFVVVGLVQGLAFQTPQLGTYLVGSMEFAALCLGSVFILRNMEED